MHGTDFQRKVWRALRRVPAGRTASYQDIAHAIGAPKATRAVAGACGANPVSIAVPCHRIVHRDGSISGYRWGVERKRKLLALEARYAARETK
jgi:AraC family transcriptional regulator of adaptative response/methylated-DNA-[protein]-cysteine methyltransferase